MVIQSESLQRSSLQPLTKPPLEAVVPSAPLSPALPLKKVALGVSGIRKRELSPKDKRAEEEEWSPNYTGRD